jgi:hypothetical protein
LFHEPDKMLPVRFAPFAATSLDEFASNSLECAGRALRCDKPSSCAHKAGMVAVLDLRSPCHAGLACFG